MVHQWNTCDHEKNVIDENLQFNIMTLHRKSSNSQIWRTDFYIPYSHQIILKVDLEDVWTYSVHVCLFDFMFISRIIASGFG